MVRPLAVLLLALAPLAAGAETRSYTWTPQSAQGAGALQAGVSRYVPQGGAVIRQAGQGNQATLSQSGAGDRALVVQRGSGNSASLDQAGGGNSYALIQLGRDATADVAQTGGQAGITVQVGRPDKENLP